MRLILTSEQAAQVEPFTGTNASTSGQLRLELGAVPTSSLPALRDAIVKAPAPKAPGPQKPKAKSKE